MISLPNPFGGDPLKVYVAGPMTGLPMYNFGAFFDAERRLAMLGYEVINPARHDEDEGWVKVTRDPFGGILDVAKDKAFDWHEALGWDLRQINDCVAIYMLPGWSRSRGACKEYEQAKDLGIWILGAVGETPARVVTHQPLVGLVGYAQSGKDTFAGMLGYHRIAFADALKDLALAANPVFSEPTGSIIPGPWNPLGYYIGQYGWEYAKAEVTGVREFLQDLGVGVRDVIGADTWVQAAFAKYDPTQPTVITDVRFPNEIEAIRARGGVIVRIDRAGNQPPNNHVSEFAWQDTEPDYRVANNKGLKSLAAKALVLDAALRRKVNA